MTHPPLCLRALVLLALACAPRLAHGSEVAARLRVAKKGAWAPLASVQAQVAGKCQKLVLLPQDVYEDAFRKLTQPDGAHRLLAPGPPPKVAAVLGNVTPGFLFARIRAELKKEALYTGATYGAAPLIGLHPFQCWLIASRIGLQGPLPLAFALARLGATLAGARLDPASAALDEVFSQRDSASVLAGYARYRVARARPGADADALASTLRSLELLARRGEADDPLRLLAGDLRAMLASLAPRPEVAAAVLYAARLDLLMATTLVEGTLTSRGKSAALPEELPARVRRVLLLDDVLGGLQLRPAERRTPGRAQEVLRQLDELEAWVEGHLAPARGLRDRALERLALLESAEPARASRLRADLTQAIHGGDPSDPAPGTLAGAVSTPDARARVAAALRAGVPAAPGGRGVFAALLGDPSASPPVEGLVASLRRDLDERILPALSVEQSAETDPRALAVQLARLDRHRASAAQLEAQLTDAGLEASVDATLRGELSRHREAIASLTRQLLSPDPLARAARRRRLEAALSQEDLSDDERGALNRVLDMDELRGRPPASGLASRLASLERALAVGEDEAGRSPRPPAVVDAMRVERDRLRRRLRQGATAGGRTPPVPDPSGEDVQDLAGLPSPQARLALARWMAENGSNPFGLPPYAPAAEVRALVEEAIQRRSSAPAPAQGASPEPLEEVAERYRFWVEARDPSLRDELLERLEVRRATFLSNLSSAPLGASTAAAEGTASAAPTATP